MHLHSNTQSGNNQHHHHHHQSLLPPSISVTINSIDNVNQIAPNTHLSQSEDNHHRHQPNMAHSSILAPTNRSRSTDEKGKRQGQGVIMRRKKKKCQDCEGDLVHAGDSTFQGLLMLNRHLSSQTCFSYSEERSRGVMIGGGGRGNGDDDFGVNGLGEYNLDHNLDSDDDDSEYACAFCCRLICTNCAVVDTDRRCLDCLYR